MEPERTYRTRLSLRLAVAAAAALWGAAALALARVPGVGASLILGAVVMSAFFAASAIGYQRAAIRVTPRGFVARSLLRRDAVPFEDVLQVVVHDGPVGRAYAVLTRRGTFRFSCLFARHRELLDALVEGAGLDAMSVA